LEVQGWLTSFLILRKNQGEVIAKLGNPFFYHILKGFTKEERILKELYSRGLNFTRLLKGAFNPLIGSREWVPGKKRSFY